MEQQQESELPIFGRKVFFLNPTFSMRAVIDTLKKEEYEVYVLIDYKLAKAYMRIHHDALLYINPEEQLPIAAWLNFFRTLKEDPTFSSTTIGICCERLAPLDLKALQDCPYITGGIFRTEGQPNSIIPSLTEKLDSLGAKGKRKFVRADCTNDASAGFLWISGGRMFKARLIDISTASVAILLPSSNLPFLNTKTEIVVSLQLNGRQLQVHVKALVVKPNGPNSYAAIFVINNETTEENNITLIREYIFETLERDITQSVMGFAIDKTNYASV